MYPHRHSPLQLRACATPSHGRFLCVQEASLPRFATPLSREVEKYPKDSNGYPRSGPTVMFEPKNLAFFTRKNQYLGQSSRVAGVSP